MLILFLVEKEKKKLPNIGNPKIGLHLILFFSLVVILVNVEYFRIMIVSSEERYFSKFSFNHILLVHLHILNLYWSSCYSCLACFLCIIIGIQILGTTSCISLYVLPITTCHVFNFFSFSILSHSYSIRKIKQIYGKLWLAEHKMEHKKWYR